MKIMRACAKILSILAIAVVVLISAVNVIIGKTPRQQFLVVQTDSMKPALVSGDLVVVRKMATANLKPGDIVSYRSPQNQSVIITHRIVRINQATHTVMTKGDAVTPADEPLNESLILGKVTNRIATLGTVLAFLREPTGLIAACYLPALLTIVQEIMLVTRHYRQPKYRLL